MPCLMDGSLWAKLEQGQALGLRTFSFSFSLQHQVVRSISRLKSKRILLRLVDPMGLGEFRWLAFQKDNSYDLILSNRFLKEPIS